MNQSRPKIEWLVWGALAATTLVIAFVSVREKLAPKPEPPPGVFGKVPAFTLTNQLGQAVSGSNLIGQVWIADVIFSRCPIACERMSRKMAALQTAIAPGQPVKFISLTADPGFDTPAVLQKYGDRHQSAPERWHFLTGPKKDIYELAINGLKFIVVDNTEKNPPSIEEYFLHSQQFVLVDQQGRIRGWFDSTEPDTQQKILSAVQALAREK